MKARNATVKRITKETSINLTVNLDGSGKVDVNTGYGMADHLLTLIGFWACFDLKVKCTGDLDIDAHHTVEDVGFCLGQAVLEALGDRKGIRRVGFAKVPMDEAIADVAVDLSGRSQLVYNGDALLPPFFAGEERDLWREFFRALTAGARMNLHISYLYGKNGHHLIESVGKGLGLSLRDAARITGDNAGVSSTKGSLD